METSFLELAVDRDGSIQRVIFDPEGLSSRGDFLGHLGVEDQVWLEAIRGCHDRHKPIQRTFSRGRTLPSVRFRFKPTAKGVVMVTGHMIPPQGEKGTFHCTSLEAAVTGWAHDLNNLFTIMTHSLDLAEHRLSSGKDPVGDLRRIRRGVQRARSITEWIMRMMRNSSLLDAIHFAPTLVLEEMTDMLSAALKGVTLRVRIDPLAHGAILFGLPEDLGRIVFNLCINAAQAIRSGRTGRGTVRVLCRVEETASRRLSIQIRDDGPGMEDQEIKRILYHGTSSPSGHGIGLSAVKDLVRNLGGVIDASAVPGQGCSFHLQFPLVSLRPAPEDPQVERRGGESIGLLLPRRHVKLYGSYLSSLGYGVHEIPSPEHLDQYRDELDLLLIWSTHRVQQPPARRVTVGEASDPEVQYQLPLTKWDLTAILSRLDQEVPA